MEARARHLPVVALVVFTMMYALVGTLLVRAVFLLVGGDLGWWRSLGLHLVFTTYSYIFGGRE